MALLYPIWLYIYKASSSSFYFYHILIFWSFVVNYTSLAMLLKFTSKVALRSRLCIQLICIFQQYHYNLNNQFVNISPKIYNADKNYKDLVWHILLTVRMWGSASYDTEMQALNYSMRCNPSHLHYHMR